VNWNREVNNLPEFDVLYNDYRFEKLEEKKTEKDEKGAKIDQYYYPGFTFVVTCVRNPLPIVMSSFFPAYIVGIFLLCTFFIEKYADRLGNLSVCLLTYIAIFDQLRRNIPKISRLTYSDFIVLWYVFASLLPLWAPLKTSEEETDENGDLILLKSPTMAESYLTFLRGFSGSTASCAEDDEPDVEVEIYHWRNTSTLWIHIFTLVATLFDFCRKYRKQRAHSNKPPPELKNKKIHEVMDEADS